MQADAPTLRKWAFVLYDTPGAQLWHQRLVLGAIAGSLATRPIVATPDADVYEEALGELSDDNSAVRWSDRYWPPPAGVAPRSTSLGNIIHLIHFIHPFHR